MNSEIKTLLLGSLRRRQLLWALRYSRSKSELTTRRHNTATRQPYLTTHAWENERVLDPAATQVVVPGSSTQTLVAIARTIRAICSCDSFLPFRGALSDSTTLSGQKQMWLKKIVWTRWNARGKSVKKATKTIFSVFLRLSLLYSFLDRVYLSPSFIFILFIEFPLSLCDERYTVHTYT